jgi:UDP:flavonoid glycosyltransferase YjiC (YdhE family)
VPQTLLLPYCDLVVTHGGFNTVQSALSQGLPMIIVPLSADQPFNAEAASGLTGAASVTSLASATGEPLCLSPTHSELPRHNR